MYTTFGWISSTRYDCCEHEHGTRDEAQRCLVAHQLELRRAGKVSKRQVVEAESLDELLDAADDEADFC